MKVHQTLLAGCLGALLLGISSYGAAAQQASWDYLSLELVGGGDLEETGFPKEDLEGIRFEAAKGFGDFAIARAASNAYHFSQVSDFDVGSQQFGAGAHYPLMTGPMLLDMWGTVNYERYSYLGLIGTGPGIDIGLRAQFSGMFEVGIMGKVFGDLDFGPGTDADYTGYAITANFQIMPVVAIQGSFSNYELDVDSTGGNFKQKHKDVFGLGVRFYY